MKARIVVMLKEGVLDPQGKAVAGALHELGYAEVGEVRIGRVIELEMEGGNGARERLEGMCRRLLANPVMEEFRIELTDAGRNE